MRKAGFTLIELLIVVAIIAILAAIALPNFLEAQTRAKVSRVQSDLRSISLAVEMFRLDNNAYPPHNDNPGDLAGLTAPRAYMSALPHDVFPDPGQAPLVGPYYIWQDLEDIYYNKMPSWGGGTWLEDQVAQGRLWSLSSPGPDRVEDMHADASLVYDPTNGTLSQGDIYRLGP